jgi:twitching motility two-component system response regulator PilH
MKKILVIDHDQDFCGFIRSGLEETGKYKVICCSSSLDAASVAEAVDPEIILLDIVLPGISGRQIANQLSRNPATARIPIIFFKTADPADPKSALPRASFETRPTLTKPVSIKELVRVLQSVL